MRETERSRMDESTIEIVPAAALGAEDMTRWQELLIGRPAQNNPFLAPEFVVATAAVRPQVWVARLHASDGAIAGYFPFEYGRAGLGRPVASGLSDAQGVIHAPGFHWESDSLLQACGLAVIEFDHLVAAQDGFAPYVRRTEPSPIIDLTGGYDAYIEARRRESRSFRRLVSRSAALFDAHRDVRFEYRTADPGVLDTLFAWKSDQYRRTGRIDRFARPWVRELVRRLMGIDNEHFTGVLASLSVDGQPIAVQAALATPSVMALWFPAYRPDFARHSPGNVLRLELIRAAAERGIACIDMGKGFSPHKEQLKTGELEVGEARVERWGPRALIHRAYQEPPRRIERFVLDHPRLRIAARRTLARIGQARVSANGAHSSSR